MMNGNGGFGGMGAGTSLLMLLVLAALLLLAVWAVRSPLIGTHGSSRAEPLAVLKQRYAAGEITNAEYEQARRAIE
jgi:uncharacterized membrane protein